jgi:hypothetical protein
MFDDILRKIGEIIDEKEEKFKKTPSFDVNKNINKEEDDEIETPTITNYDENEEDNENDALSELDKILDSISKKNEEEEEKEDEEEKKNEESDIKESDSKKLITNVPKNSKTSSVKYSSFIEYLENSF